MLPKLDVPIYELTLISSGKKIRFRPFLVKEQKLLLMISQGEDNNNETVNVVKQILKNCVVDDINIDDLPTFDLEHLFLNLRARSVNEIVELRYKCNNIVEDEKGEDKKCDSLEKFEIKLLDIKPTKGEGHDNTIKLTEKMGIVMKYPTFEMITKLDGKSEDEILMELLTNCVDYIYDADNIYKAKDTPREEIIEFIDSMQQKDLEKIQNFFETAPKIKHTIEFKCRKCKYEENIPVEGLQSFFI
jgi:hypothetical protein